jgi:hypothetical protein
LVENFRQSPPVAQQNTLFSGDTNSGEGASSFQVTRRINVGQVPGAVKAHSSEPTAQSEGKLQSVSLKDIRAQKPLVKKVIAREEAKEPGQINLAEFLNAHR